MRLLTSVRAGGEITIEDNPKLRNHNAVQDEEANTEEYILDEFTEEDFLFDEEDDNELKPLAERKWIKRIVAGMVAVMLLVNLVAFFPNVYNLQAIQFLKKTRQLSQIEEIVQYKQAIVVVKADDRKGTGFNIDEQGIIVTNEHVVGDAKFASISFEDGIYRAEVIATDASIDFALLKVVQTDHASMVKAFPKLSIDSSGQWDAGMPIYVIGNPLFFNRIANEGAILGMTSIQDWELPVMAIQAPIYKGNSGSPIINHDGMVIAVVFATSKLMHEGSKTKVGLAIPIEYLQTYMDPYLD